MLFESKSALTNWALSTGAELFGRFEHPLDPGGHLKGKLKPFHLPKSSIGGDLEVLGRTRQILSTMSICPTAATEKNGQNWPLDGESIRSLSQAWRPLGGGVCLWMAFWALRTPVCLPHCCCCCCYTAAAADRPNQTAGTGSTCSSSSSSAAPVPTSRMSSPSIELTLEPPAGWLRHSA